MNDAAEVIADEVTPEAGHASDAHGNTVSGSGSAGKYATTETATGNYNPRTLQSAPSNSANTEANHLGIFERAVSSEPVDTLAIASGRAPPSPHRRGSPLVDHITGEIFFTDLKT